MSHKYCPACRAANDAVAAFCGTCGAAFAAAQSGAGAAPYPQPSTGQPGGSGYVPPVPPGYAPPPPQGYAPPTPQGPIPGLPDPARLQQSYFPVTDADVAKTLQAAQVAGMILPAGMVPAGFWIRAGASIIDGLIFMVLGYFTPASLAFLSNVVLPAAYTIYLWLSKGQTVGKMVLGLYVISTDGTPLTLGKSVLRYIGYYVSGIMLGLGFLAVLVDDARRGVHDRIAGTIVVRKI